MFATHEERAARGAKWLDRVRPGWHKMIDVITLDPESETRCVIGQVFGDFTEVMNEKFLIPARWEGEKKMFLHPGVYFGIIWTVRHGFQITPWHGHEEAAWRAAWAKEIEEREGTVVADTFPAEWGERTPAATIVR